MSNIFSTTAPVPATDFRMALYILTYLLFIAVILGIGISLCMYIDHRRQAKLCSVIFDEERDLSEGKGAKTAFQLSNLQSHQDQDRQLATDVQSCTCVDEGVSLLGSQNGAIAPISGLDESPKLEYAIGKQVAFARRSRTDAAAQFPKRFTKYGMTEAGFWNELEMGVGKIDSRSRREGISQRGAEG